MKAKNSKLSGQKRGQKLSGAPTAFPVFLIEDNREMGGSLATMLSAQGLSVLATASTGPDALAQVKRLKPRLVLVDAALGDQGSLTLVRAVRKLSPAIKVIVMHLATSHRDIVEFVRAGVSGFIMKDATPAEFVRTIRLVADGVSVLPDLITAKLFSHVASRAAGPSPQS